MMADNVQWLRAKIDCVNTVNAEAKIVVNLLRGFFSQFIGQKVVKKTNGNLLESIKKNMPTLTDTPTLLVTLNSNCSRDIIVTITGSIRFDDEKPLARHQSIFYIADVSTEGVLTEVSSSPVNGRDDYTLQEVAQLRDSYRLAKEEEERLKKELGVFAALL